MACALAAAALCLAPGRAAAESLALRLSDALAGLPPGAGPEAASESRSGPRVAGYLKSFALRSKAAEGAAETVVLSLTRMRLQLDYEITPHAGLHVEHDTELRAGSYLRSAEFRHGPQPAQYWRAGGVLADRPGYHLSHRLFRAYLRGSIGAVDVTLGRQRIGLGVGRLWSALDMLNPVNPVQIERDEAIGVDAALVEFKTGALSKFSAAYAPDPNRRADRWVGQYRTNLSGSDLNLTYAKFWSDHALGIDLATQIGDAGVRAEWVITRPQQGEAFHKFLLGWDYAFAGGLTIGVELLRNIQGTQQMQAQFARNPQLAQVQPMGNSHVGATLAYDFTPLTKGTAYILHNRSDGSRFVAPVLTHALSSNLTIAGGAQFFSGSAGSEYGRGMNLGFVQIQWFY